MSLWEDIRRRVDLREIVGRTHQINRNGKILCPFHTEKTPSCHIYPDHYYCFGCGAHGDVFDWLAAAKNISRWQALVELAQELGMQAQDIEKAREAFRKYENMSRAAAYWHDRLWKNPEVVEYLHGRGLTDETIKTFLVGYRPETGQIVLPVTDVYGHPVGWQFHNWSEDVKKQAAARAAAKKGVRQDLIDVPKYETMYGLRRAATLFGICQARALWETAGVLYMAEGPYDAMSLYQEGVPAVATMGALSAGQMKLILAYFPDTSIVLVPDTTDEGFEKCEQAGRLIRALCQLPLKVVQLEEKDANDALVAGTLNDQLKRSKNYWVWLAARALKKEDRQEAEVAVRKVYQQADLAAREEIEKLVAEAWGVEASLVRRALNSRAAPAVPIYTADDAWERWERIVDMATRASRWELGFPVLDRYLDLIPGKIFHIEGRAGIGKTALLVQMLLNLVVNAEPARVVIVGFEPSPEDIISRVAINLGSSLGYLSDAEPATEMQQAQKLRADEEAWEAVRQVIHDIIQPNVAFLHGPMSLDKVAAAIARAETHVLQAKANFVFIDYLDLAETEYSAFYRHNFEIVKKAQALAASTNTCVFALRQVARGRASSRVAEPGEAAGMAVGEAQTDVEITIRRRFPEKNEPLRLIAKIRKNRGGLEWPQALGQGLIYYPQVYRVEHWTEVDAETEAKFIKEDAEREKEAAGK